MTKTFGARVLGLLLLVCAPAAAQNYPSPHYTDVTLGTGAGASLATTLAGKVTAAQAAAAAPVQAVAGLTGSPTAAQLKGSLAITHSDITDWSATLTAAIAANPSSYITAAGAPVQAVAGLTGSPTASQVKGALAIVPGDVAGFSASASGAAPVQAIAGLTGSPNAAAIKAALAIIPGDITGFATSASAAAPVQGVGSGCSLDVNKLVTCTGSGGGVSVPPSVPFLASTSGGGLQAASYTPYNATNPAGYIAASGAPVQSVAGLTGAPTAAQVKSALTIAPSDVTGFNASAASAAPVQSVAGLTGSPTAAQTKTALAIVPGDVSGFSASASSAAPVQTVAGRAGGVVITTSDLADFASAWATQFSAALGTTSGKAYPGNNPSSFITASGAPVQSVAGLTGAPTAATLKGALAIAPGDITGFASAASAASPVQSAGSNCTLVSGVLNCAGGGLAAPSGTPAFLAYNGSALVASAFTPENSTNKDATSGYAGLIGGQLSGSELANIASVLVTNPLTPANSLAAMQMTLSEVLNDVVKIDIVAPPWNMIGDNATENLPEFNSVIARVNSLCASGVITQIRVPKGIYLLGGASQSSPATATAFSPGCTPDVEGDTENQGIFQLGINFGGATFTASNLPISSGSGGGWINTPGTVVASTYKGGPTFKRLSIWGNRNSANEQDGIDLRGAIKEPNLEGLDFLQLPGSMLKLGYPDSTGQGVASEGHIYNLRGLQVGLAAGSINSKGAAPIDITCTVTGSSDCTNQLEFMVTRVSRGYGPANLYIHPVSNKTGIRQLKFYSFDGENPTNGPNIKICDTDPTNCNNAVQATFIAPVSNNGAHGTSGISITCPTGTAYGNRPNNLEFDALITLQSTGASNIDDECGYGDTFRISQLSNFSQAYPGASTAINLSGNSTVDFTNAGNLYTVTGATPTTASCTTGTGGAPTGSGSYTDGSGASACTETYVSAAPLGSIVLGGSTPTLVSGTHFFDGSGQENTWGNGYVGSGIQNDFLIPAYTLPANSGSFAFNAPGSGGGVTAPAAAVVVSSNGTTLSPASIVNNRLLGNFSGSTGAPSAGTVTAALDSIDATQGDMLFRNSLQWIQLALGTPGQLLAVNGGGTAPAWFTPNYLPNVAPAYTGTMTGGALTLSGSENIGAALSVTGNITTNVTSAPFLKTSAGGVVQAGTFGTGSGQVPDAGTLGTASTKAASASGQSTVASVSGTIVAGHLATFADTAGTVQDGGAVPTGGGSGTVTSVAAGSGLAASPSPITGSGTLSHAVPAGAAVGTYGDSTHYPVITTDQFGHVTAAVPTGFPASSTCQAFTSSGTFTKLSASSMVAAWAIGGGGAGGSGAVLSASASGSGGAAGGGGDQAFQITPAALLPSSMSVTVGAAGAQATAASTNGGLGGDSSVGTWLVAHGGGGGGFGASGAVSGGGGGGSVGSVAASGAGPTAGAAAGLGGSAGGAGAVGGTGQIGGTGGAGGGSGATGAAFVGGWSLSGASGGGGGGGWNAGAAVAGANAASTANATGAIGASRGAGGAATGANGGAGGAPNYWPNVAGGAGGGGGGGNTGGAGGTGGTGGFPGGAGGGGGAGTSVGLGGIPAAGEVYMCQW